MQDRFTPKIQEKRFRAPKILPTAIGQRVRLEGIEIDSLTGLLKRESLKPVLDKLIHELSSNETGNRPPSDMVGVIVVFFDLDDFKQINDVYGHTTGDEALAEVGPRLKSAVKRMYDSVYRYGGDEFVMVLPIKSNENISEERLKTVFEKRRKEIEDDLHITKRGTRIDLKLSMGYKVYMRGDPSTTAQKLIEKADERMYINKNERKSKQPE